MGRRLRLFDNPVLAHGGPPPHQIPAVAHGIEVGGEAEAVVGPIARVVGYYISCVGHGCSYGWPEGVRHAASWERDLLLPRRGHIIVTTVAGQGWLAGPNPSLDAAQC